MNTIPQDMAVLRAALVADETLLKHRAACTTCNDNTLCSQAQQLDEQAAKLRGVALGSDSGLAELETIMSTAESIVRDIVQIASMGRLDHDVQTAFRCWISEALLLQPTTRQIDQLCRAAGFAGPVDVATMRQRVDEWHATINELQREWSICAAQLAVLYEVAQIIVVCWEQSDLAQAVRRLATLLPQPRAVSDETAARE